jgi:hypothetical protein
MQERLPNVPRVASDNTRAVEELRLGRYWGQPFSDVLVAMLQSFT